MKKIDNSTATIDDEFTDGDPGTGTPATILPAEYLNVIQAELAKFVEMAGITLDQTAVDKEQIAEALAVHVAGLDFYNDTGAADAYVLSAIGAAAAENKIPPAYFNGMRTRFLPDNNNTGAATARVGALAIKDIKRGAGAGVDPSAGEIVAGVLIELYFDATNDCWKFSQAISSAPAFEGQLLHLQNQQVNGVNSDAGATSYTKLTLNTILTNEIAGASLVASVISLPAGEYYQEIDTPAGTGSTTTLNMRFRLRDTTNSVTLSESNSQQFTDPGTVPIESSGRFTLSGTANIELQGIAGASGGSWGVAGSLGTQENYENVKIWKVG